MSQSHSLRKLSLADVCIQYRPLTVCMTYAYSIDHLLYAYVSEARACSYFIAYVSEARACSYFIGSWPVRALDLAVSRACMDGTLDPLRA